MKFFAASAALALLATVVQAAPAPAPVEARTFNILVEFQGAADAKFSQSFPADGTVVKIKNPLSISHIKSYGGGTCSFTGIDGSHTVTVGAQTVDVGPPQTQIRGSCRAF